MIETTRLSIIPLSHKQLHLYLQGKNKLEKDLGLSMGSRVVSPEVKEKAVFFILPLVKSAKDDHYLFYTFWVIIDKASKTIVAELGFKGPPNDKGEVEIGYGSFWGEHNKGIMTEAVAAVLLWASKRNDIQYILAETNEANKASIRVLEKNHFQVFERKGDMLWWKISTIPSPIL